MTAAPRLDSDDRVGSRAVEERLAQRRAAGGDVLALHGGPDLPLPPHLRAAVVDALAAPGPRPSRGLPALREAIAAALAAEGAAVDPAREVLVTSGAMHALNVVLRTLLRPGDNVVMPAPEFFFEGIVRRTGAEPRWVPGSARDGWRWDLEGLAAAIDGRTRVVLFSNPTNPTGALPSASDLRAVSDLARRHGAIVVSDESYDRFVYPEGTFTSILRERDDAAVLVRSLSKSHALPTWRVGYVVAEPALTDAFTRTLEWDCLHGPHVAQVVAAAALTGPQDWLAEALQSYRPARDAVVAAVAASPALACVTPAATPFAFVDVRALERDGTPALDRLLDAGIPAVPGEAFQSPGHARIPFGGTPETIRALADRLAALGG